MLNPPINHDSIQGNILKPFGRKKGVYLFAQLEDDPARVRPRLSALLSRFVTPASRQEQITQKWKATQQSNVVGMCGLSAGGYRRLGLDASFPKQDELGSSLFE